jgi:hypothetical protein
MFLRVRRWRCKEPAGGRRLRSTYSACPRRRTRRSGCRRTRRDSWRRRFPTWAAQLRSSAAGSKALACRLRSWLRRRFAGHPARAPAVRRCFRSTRKWFYPAEGCRSEPRPAVCGGIACRPERTQSRRRRALRQQSTAARAGAQARRWEIGLKLTAPRRSPATGASGRALSGCARRDLCRGRGE